MRKLFLLLLTTFTPRKVFALISVLTPMSVFVPAAVAAQGRLMGRIIDQAGSPLAAATIYISGVTTTQATLSNAQGYYTFLSLPEGIYTIKATKRGMPAWDSQVSITPSVTARIDIHIGTDAPKQAKVTIATDEERKVELARIERLRLERERQREEARKAEEQNTPPPPPPPQPTKEELEALELQKAAAKAQADFEAAVAIPEKEVGIAGGEAALYKNLQYPDVARKLKIQGKVITKILVAADGSVQNVEFLQKAHDVLNEEVFRTLTEDVKFTPAQTVGGKPVASSIVIPITFNLGKGR